jgi:hypothetical protein
MATPCSQDHWIAHVLDAKPERHQPRALTLLCAMPDAENQPACESLRDPLTEGNCQPALWVGACLPQDRACVVTCDYSFIKRWRHRHTSGMIESHGMTVRLCTTAAPYTQPLDSGTATSWEVPSVTVFSTTLALATCKSCQWPSCRSKRCSVVCSSRRTRSTAGNSLSLTRGSPLGPGIDEGGRS